MNKTWMIACFGSAFLGLACATPRQRRENALRVSQAKLGHYPKGDFVRKYGNPRQCRITWTGETCEFYKHRGLTGQPSPISQTAGENASDQDGEMVWIDFDHDGFSMRDLSAAGY